MSFEKEIKEHHANRKLNILKGFKDFDEHFEKGKSRKDNPNLQEKKITDKRGHQTTRYVKTGDDEKSEKKSSKKTENDSGDKKSGKQDKNQKYLKETSDADLKKFVDSSDDSKLDLKEMAKRELEKRSSEKSVDDKKETADIDFNDPEDLKAYATDYGSELIEIMQDDLFMSLKDAAKLHNANKSKNEAVNKVQEALDSLKDSDDEDEDLDSSEIGSLDDEEVEEVENMAGFYASDFAVENIGKQSFSDFKKFLKKNKNNGLDFTNEEKITKLFKDFQKKQNDK